MQILRNKWHKLLKDEFEKEYYLKIINFLNKEYESLTIYPNKNDVFNALQYTDYSDVKVVILGQDPYHGPNQAHGLSFSVKPNVALPPSLKNIYKELQTDIGCTIPSSGYLKKWADQGVLLLNTVLTVRSGQANSHKNIGWEHFTNRVIELLNERDEGIVFILWGKNSQAKLNLITNSNHFVIKSAHPSPLSAHNGFWGSKPFSKTNNILTSIGKAPIDWQI